MVEMNYVESSNIEQVGYDKEAMELHIIFKSSGLYIYHGVSVAVYEEFISAASLGSYLNREIKGVYEFEKR